jgi:hypothetical protein
MNKERIYTKGFIQKDLYKISFLKKKTYTFTDKLKWKIFFRKKCYTYLNVID